jgi:uncharacterized membrane protein
MPSDTPRLTDVQVEQFLGSLLRAGVLTAAAVVLVGGVLYLRQFGQLSTDRRIFESEPADLRSISGIVRDAMALDSRGIIQFGLLLLIATPVARVFFSVIAFAIEGDGIYVGIALIVLGILLYSLSGGHVHLTA